MQVITGKEGRTRTNETPCGKSKVSKTIGCGGEANHCACGRSNRISIGATAKRADLRTAAEMGWVAQDLCEMVDVRWGACHADAAEIDLVRG